MTLALLRMLQDVAAASGDAVTVDDLFDVAIERICEATGWRPGQVIFAVDGTSCPSVVTPSWHEAGANTAGATMIVGRPTPAARQELAVRAMRSRTVECSADELPSEDGARHPMGGIHSSRGDIAVPVIAGGDVVAALVFPLGHDMPDTAAHAALAGVGRQLGCAVQRIRTSEALREEMERHSAIIEMQQEVAGTTLDGLAVMSLIEERARTLARATICTVARVHGDAIVSSTLDARLRRAGVQLKVQSTLAGRCFEEGGILSSDDAACDPRIDQAAVAALGIRSLLALPIGGESGTLGVLLVGSDRVRAFNDRDVQALQLVAGLLSAVMARAMAFEASQRLLAERTAALGALRESEARFQAFMDNTPVVASLNDADGRYLYVNRSFEERFRTRLADVRGKTAFDVFPADVARALLERDAEALSTNGMVETELRVPAEEGDDESWLVYTFPVRDAHGRTIIGVAALDISERRDLTRQLLQAQKLEAIGQLAAGIAHEINTPTQYVGDNIRFLENAFRDVAALLGPQEAVVRAARELGVLPALVDEAESLARAADIDYLREEIPTALQQSLEGVARIAEIVRGMKAFAHPGTDGKTAVDLNQAIDNTITVSRNEWKYVAEVVTDYDRHLPAVPCFAGELNQVVLNLLVNAAHAIGDVVATAPGTQGCIRVSTRAVAGWVEIRVGDTGTGIPDEIRSRIFDQFFTTKPVGQGTGQGLSLAHRIVTKRHGGTLTFETEVGRGTTFVVRLPLDTDVAVSA